MLAVITLACFFQVASDLPTLEPGRPATYSLDGGHGAVESGGLAGQGAWGLTVPVEVAEQGTYTIQLRSARFDAYLQLTDSEGTVLAEDDDGWTGTQARLVVELQAGQDYFVRACALRAGVGAFEITLHEGAPAHSTAEQAHDAALADFRWGLGQLALEIEDPETLMDALQAFGESWFNRGFVEQGLAVLQQRVDMSSELWGAESSSTASAHYDHAFLLMQSGRPEEAEPEMRAAVSTLEQTLGPDAETTLVTFVGLGHLEQSRGRALQARSWFERAAAGFARRAESGTRNGLTVDVSLASTLLSLSENQLAHELLVGAIEKAEALGPSGEDLVAHALASLSEMEGVAGNFEAAYELKMRSRAIMAKQLPPTHPNMLATDLNLLGTLRAVGRMAEYRELGEDLHGRLVAASRTDTRLHAVLLLELARAAHDATEFELALERARESALIAQTVGDQSLLATSLAQLADTQLRLGHLAEARDPLEVSIELLRANDGESGAWAKQLSTFGSLLYDLGDNEEAIKVFRRAGAWYEARGLDTALATNLGGLGVSLIRLGRLDEALTALSRAFSLDEASGASPRFMASNLSNLGLVHERSGDLAEAEGFFQRALTMLEQSEKDHTLAQASFHCNLAIVQRRLGKAQAAAESGARVLVLAPHFETPTRVLALDNLALTWLDLGDVDQAWTTLQQAAQRLRAETDVVLAASSEPERYRHLVFRLAHLDHVLAVAELQGTEEARTSAYEELLHWKGLVGRQLLATREQLAQDLSPELRLITETLRDRRAQLSHYARSTDETQIEALRIEVARLERELQGQVDLAGAGGGISFAQLRDAIPDDGVVVDFAVHMGYGRSGAGAPISTQERVVTAFVTRAGDTVPVRVDLGSAAAMEAALASHLEEISSSSLQGGLLAARGGSPGRPSSPQTHGLSELLWQPIAPLVAGAEILFVAPEGALATLPFETLLMDDGRFVLEEHGVVTLSDAGSLTRASAPRNDQLDSLLVFGDVDYGARAPLDEAARPSLLRSGVTSSWDQLPATAVEADGVLGAHEDNFGTGGQRLTLRGSEATEERLLAELGRFDTVHLATHGYFRPPELVSAWDAARGGGPTMADRLAGRRPGLLSGLVCAGANSQVLGRADGYLTAEELGSADLTGVELVVLSACETGLGRAQAGEGLLGLRRAFLTAGASTVISSLWSVPDAPTAELMEAFYDNLWRRGLGRRAALRTAQLQLLERNRDELLRPDVQSWGAFVLDGEWR